MSDKITEILTKLAEKFGTTIEHLWGVLVKQALVSAIVDVITAVILVAGWCSLLFFLRVKSSAISRDSKHSKDDNFLMQEGILIGWIALWIYGIFCVWFLFCALDTAVTATMNPEYWALKHLVPR